MPRQVITRPGSVATPLDVELGGLEVLEPQAAFAHFDGSGAAGEFLPCVTYYTQDGLVFARAFPADAVAAGASADVSWFPGLSAAPGVVPTTGIFYDIDNSGGLLEVHTTDANPGDYALVLQADQGDAGLVAAGGSVYVTSFDGDVNVQPFGINGATPAQFIVQAQGAITMQSGIGTAAGLSKIDLNADGDLNLRCNGTNHILLTGGPVQFAAGTTVGFFGAAPVAKAAAPVTLADVITILRNLGLCA